MHSEFLLNRKNKYVIRTITLDGVWIGAMVSASEVGNSMPFCFKSVYICTTPCISGFVLKASAQLYNSKN